MAVFPQSHRDWGPERGRGTSVLAHMNSTSSSSYLRGFVCGAQQGWQQMFAQTLEMFVFFLLHWLLILHYGKNLTQHYGETLTIPACCYWSRHARDIVFMWQVRNLLPQNRKDHTLKPGKHKVGTFGKYWLELSKGQSTTANAFKNISGVVSDVRHSSSSHGTDALHTHTHTLLSHKIQIWAEGWCLCEYEVRQQAATTWMTQIGF